MVDVIAGGVRPAALAGMECIIDVATGHSPDQAAATELFTTAARNLYEADGGRRAAADRGVHHRDRPVHHGLRRREGHLALMIDTGMSPMRRRAAQASFSICR